ncbi:hypothetical protein M514_09507 [Trichuris suis]|uniref:Retrotransposon gag domain-containing protein n=1 Tax=Trichuris suis TaxID=68888 RepID=A0A085NA37_9BILA|nr:hypothetical protein M513_09507 [Trichuris suis]KFD66333.1 hypothetical protein M514_09507 [Trichuris suis]
MYGCESWTIRKADRRRTDAFELWCWRGILRVRWTARRTNASILEEAKPGHSLKSAMLKLKLQFFGHLMRRPDSLEKSLMLCILEGKRRRGRPKLRWIDGITEATNQSLARQGAHGRQEGLEVTDSWDHAESNRAVALPLMLPKLPLAGALRKDPLKTYSIIRSLTFPDSPASKSFEQYQRWLQYSDETVTSYVAELRRLAQYCNFRDTLDSRLRDQLVCGPRDQKLQRQLLRVCDLAFSRALSLALTAEASNTEVAKMHLPHQGELQDVQLIRRNNHPQERVQRIVREQTIPVGPRKRYPITGAEGHIVQLLAGSRASRATFASASDTLNALVVPK